MERSTSAAEPSFQHHEGSGIVLAVQGGPGLSVRFEEQVARREPHEGPLVFGRAADIDLDDNRFLHRQVGRFCHADGVWWVEHLGGRLPVTVRSGGTSSRLTAADRTALVALESTVRIDCGLASYEIEVRLDVSPSAPPPPTPPLGLDATLDRPDIPLNEEQRLLLLLLAESRLRRPNGPHQLPSNRDGADALGWGIAKYNRKLDWLCDRLARNGVPGLQSDQGRALDRRQRLARHAVDSGLVSVEALADLDRHRAEVSGRNDS